MANYTYPGTDTLKNKYGETDFGKLERREARPVAARQVEIEAGYGPQGQFDIDHLRAIHRHLFQDIYEWAGRTRDERVPLSDDTIANEPIMHKQGGADFLISPLIPNALDGLASRLREVDYLHGLSRKEFAIRAADVMVFLNTVHAFRDGNGRTQRTFIRALAKEAGHSLDFTVVSKERMIQASIAASDHDDPTMMRRLFDEISDASRVAALHQTVEFFEKRRLSWNDRYLATMEPRYRVEVTMVGTAGDHFMARTRSQILIGKKSDLPNPPPRGHVTFMIASGRWGETERTR